MPEVRLLGLLVIFLLIEAAAALPEGRNRPMEARAASPEEKWHEVAPSAPADPRHEEERLADFAQQNYSGKKMSDKDER
jgi:hypothetical protein